MLSVPGALTYLIWDKTTSSSSIVNGSVLMSSWSWNTVESGQVSASVGDGSEIWKMRDRWPLIDIHWNISLQSILFNGMESVWKYMIYIYYWSSLTESFKQQFEMFSIYTFWAKYVVEQWMIIMGCFHFSVVILGYARGCCAIWLGCGTSGDTVCAGGGQGYTGRDIWP